ncbi:MAG: alpha/beta hydrolase-fold protein [Acidobacteriota bacterium]|nr:alpha/beta hydrolase-fold protein [Blastocatellia bacterium]MDW8411607.1 alpha/beta hydrolase-fold protein [Acidobacteriota bacterium]
MKIELERSTKQGFLETIFDFYSPQFNNTRSMVIYLPPSYHTFPERRYPVLYMQDGQNLFDPATSYAGEWQVDRICDRLISEKKMREIIVVGIYNTGTKRLYEYTYSSNPKLGGGGANKYLNFVVNTVKPFIDHHYRTLRDRINTGILGSSLGGLVALYCGLRCPEVFYNVGAMSGSFWWNGGELAKLVRERGRHYPIKIYLDAGTRQDGLKFTREMRNALLAIGFRQNRDLMFYCAKGHTHNEASWRARLHRPLTFFFPA